MRLLDNGRCSGTKLLGQQMPRPGGSYDQKGRDSGERPEAGMQKEDSYKKGNGPRSVQ